MSKNKSTEYAILYLSRTQKMDADAIAKELKITKKTVEKVLATNETVPVKKSSKVKELMIRQTAGKNTNSVAIMTPSASQQADEAIKNSVVNEQKDPPHIFRPNG